jgi:hypothetical protein
MNMTSEDGTLDQGERIVKILNEIFFLIESELKSSGCIVFKNSCLQKTRRKRKKYSGGDVMITGVGHRSLISSELDLNFNNWTYLPCITRL